MNYLLISQYTLYALILVLCAIFIIGTMLALLLFMEPVKVELPKLWSWGGLRDLKLKDGE